MQAYLILKLVRVEMPTKTMEIVIKANVNNKFVSRNILTLCSTVRSSEMQNVYRVFSVLHVLILDADIYKIFNFQNAIANAKGI